jgi:NAD-dependent SIR2 family protein deacetylase
MKKHRVSRVDAIAIKKAGSFDLLCDSVASEFKNGKSFVVLLQQFGVTKFFLAEIVRKKELQNDFSYMHSRSQRKYTERNDVSTTTGPESSFQDESKAVLDASPHADCLDEIPSLDLSDETSRLESCLNTNETNCDVHIEVDREAPSIPPFKQVEDSVGAPSANAVVNCDDNQLGVADDEHYHLTKSLEDLGIAACSRIIDEEVPSILDSQQVKDSVGAPLANAVVNCDDNQLGVADDEHYHLTKSLDDAGIAACSRIILFTGAGISTTAGVPDFRSVGGLYDKQSTLKHMHGKDAFTYRTVTISQERAESFYKYHHDLDKLCRNASPTLFHEAVKELKDSGRIVRVWDQNIDMLFDKVGVSASDYVAVHGSYSSITCTKFLHTKIAEGEFELMSDFFKNEDQIRCKEPTSRSRSKPCNALLIPNVIYFDDPRQADYSEQAINDCIDGFDLILIVGTSLSIPAMNAVIKVYQSGNKGVPTVIVNPNKFATSIRVDYWFEATADEFAKAFLGKPGNQRADKYVPQSVLQAQIGIADFITEVRDLATAAGGSNLIRVHPCPSQLVSWERNSCFFDNLFEGIFALWLRISFLRSIEWRGFLNRLFTSYHDRNYDLSKNQDMRNRLHQDLCTVLYIQYGEFGPADWLEDVLYKEEVVFREKLTISSRKSCTKCEMKQTWGLAYVDAAENDVNQESFDRVFPSQCRNCKGSIDYGCAPLLIANMQLVCSDKVTLPLEVDVGQLRYKLAFVQEALRITGDHFTSVFQLEDMIVAYDSLKTGEPVSLDEWPRYFKYPSIVIYERICAKARDSRQISCTAPKLPDETERTHLTHDSDLESTCFANEAQHAAKGPTVTVSEAVKPTETELSNSGELPHSYSFGDLDEESCIIHESLEMDVLADFASNLPEPVVVQRQPIVRKECDVEFFLPKVGPAGRKVQEEKSVMIDVRYHELAETLLDNGVSARALLKSFLGLEEKKRVLANTNTGVTKTFLDVDSICLTSDTFPIVNGPVAFFPFTNRHLNLKSHNHHYLPDPEDQKKLVPLVDFRHACLLQSGNASCPFRTLIVFPQLDRLSFRGMHRNFMASSDLKDFFEQALAPALRSVLRADEISHVPTSYEALEKVSRGTDGRYIFGSYILDNSRTHQVLDKVRCLIDRNSNLSRFRGFKYHTFCKNLKLGVKSDTSAATKEKIELFVRRWLDISLLEMASFDVGVEILPNDLTKSLFWHRDMTRQLLIAAGVNKSQIVFHENCFMTSLSGGSGECKAASSSTNSLFVQAYHTEKNSTWLPNKIDVIVPSVKDVLENKHAYSRYIGFLSESWSNNQYRGKSYGVRIEYRVRGISTALTCLEVAKPRASLLQDLHLIDTALYFSYKKLHLLAFCKIIDETRSFDLGNPFRLDFVRLIFTLIKGLHRSLQYGSAGHRDLLGRGMNGGRYDLDVWGSMECYNAPFVDLSNFDLLGLKFRTPEEIGVSENLKTGNLSLSKYKLPLFLRHRRDVKVAWYRLLAANKEDDMDKLAEFVISQLEEDVLTSIPNTARKKDYKPPTSLDLKHLLLSVSAIHARVPVPRQRILEYVLPFEKELVERKGDWSIAVGPHLFVHALSVLDDKQRYSFMEATVRNLVNRLRYLPIGSKNKIWRVRNRTVSVFMNTMKLSEIPQAIPGTCLESSGPEDDVSHVAESPPRKKRRLLVVNESEDEPAKEDMTSNQPAGNENQAAKDLLLLWIRSSWQQIEMKHIGDLKAIAKYKLSGDLESFSEASCNSCLPVSFKKRSGGEGGWRNYFDKHFPRYLPSSHVSKAWKETDFAVAWGNLITCQAESADSVRELIWEQFKTLECFPYSEFYNKWWRIERGRVTMYLKRN